MASMPILIFREMLRIIYPSNHKSALHGQLEMFSGLLRFGQLFITVRQVFFGQFSGVISIIAL
jgi:hypothetical protein